MEAHRIYCFILPKPAAVACLLATLRVNGLSGFQETFQNSSDMAQEKIWNVSGMLCLTSGVQDYFLLKLSTVDVFAVRVLLV